jgi:hypothetical protein
MNANKKLFLSAVSSEFEGCRRLLVVVRSDFIASSTASSPLL